MCGATCVLCLCPLNVPRAEEAVENQKHKVVSCVMPARCLPHAPQDKETPGAGLEAVGELAGRRPAGRPLRAGL